MEAEIKDVFLSGYVSSQAGTYFNQVLLVTELAEYSEEGIVEEYEELSKKVKESGKLYVDNIKFVAQVAGKYQIRLPEMPKHPDQYFQWIKAVQLGFSGDHLPDEIAPVFFVHATHLGDITTSLYILDNYIYLHQKFSALDFSDQIQLLLADILNLKKEIKEIELSGISKSNRILLNRSWKVLFEMAGQLAEFKRIELRQEQYQELGKLVNQLLDKSSGLATKIANGLT